MIKRIISGGQTGADRAGLEAAKSLNIPTGGSAPKNWRICNPDGSDGSDPSLADFGLVQHSSYDYRPRTMLNVLVSDGTVWFGYADSPGGRLTLSTARDNEKPTIVNPTSEELREWVLKENIKILNIAGNRQSDHNPNISRDVYEVVRGAFQEVEQELKTL